MSILPLLLKSSKSIYINSHDSFAYGTRASMYCKIGDLKSSILNLRKAIIHENNSTNLLYYKKTLSKLLLITGIIHYLFFYTNYNIIVLNCVMTFYDYFCLVTCDL